MKKERVRLVFLPAGPVCCPCSLFQKDLRCSRGRPCRLPCSLWEMFFFSSFISYALIEFSSPISISYFHFSRLRGCCLNDSTLELIVS